MTTSESTIQQYYHHARSLGAFRAADALDIAREAAAMDAAAAAKRVPLARDVATECLPDGTGLIRFSRSVRVY